jgi:hypothetical protein
MNHIKLSSYQSAPILFYIMILYFRGKKFKLKNIKLSLAVGIENISP